MPKKRILVFSLSILFIILVMTWFYPYSFFSIKKSYLYNPDSVVVNQYVRDITNFKEVVEQDLSENTSENPIDLTVDKTRSVLPILEQDWLVSKKPVPMNKQDLSTMLFEVENARDTLLNLVADQEYSSESREYLVATIGSLLRVEKSITDLINETAASRKALRIKFNNLKGEIMKSFMLYESFYEWSQEEIN
ncbi:hypothetical protein [Ornithinibacillus xuwenensis]|uniref:Uncharacterized protein n=1 Tax=Ornithinibacillus xuwenensis TaxID=3144668 RepID=A0ABU9XDD9_9BACI